MRGQGLHKQVCDAFEHVHQTKEYTEIRSSLLIYINKVMDRRNLGFQILCSNAGPGNLYNCLACAYSLEPMGRGYWKNQTQNLRIFDLLCKLNSLPTLAVYMLGH